MTSEKEIIDNTKSIKIDVNSDKVYTIDPSRFDDRISECLECGYEGTDWAEHKDYRYGPEDTAVVFCPKCGSTHYYLK